MVNYNQHDFTIIVDTREQQPWEFKEFAVAHTKLDTGDYSIEGMENVVAIERKKSVSEFANNITESRFTDVVMRMSELKYSFLLLEFNLQDVLIYPVGSNVPKKMWSKIRISPGFILKNLLDLELKYNISVHFCGDSDNAEKLAETILKKVYYIERSKY
jgi:ERCC4-type nuclease